MKLVQQNQKIKVKTTNPQQLDEHLQKQKIKDLHDHIDEVLKKLKPVKRRTNFASDADRIQYQKELRESKEKECDFTFRSQDRE